MTLPYVILVFLCDVMKLQSFGRVPVVPICSYSALRISRSNDAYCVAELYVVVSRFV